MKIIFIGNSIVNGFPHRRGQSFPSILREETGHNIINKGINGDTTQGILDRYYEDALKHRPNQVFILSGTNDFIYNVDDVEGTYENLRQLAKLANEAGAKPFLITPVLCDVEKATKYWLDGMNVNYVAVNEKLKELRNKIINGNDIYDVVDLQEEYNKLNEYMDGIHPTEEGQKYIAKCIKAYI